MDRVIFKKRTFLYKKQHLKPTGNFLSNELFYKKMETKSI